jgi:hypothetical protein
VGVQDKEEDHYYEHQVDLEVEFQINDIREEDDVDQF